MISTYYVLSKFVFTWFGCICSLILIREKTFLIRDTAGKTPEVPKDAQDMVKATGYPDFMEKKGGESYISKKVLGELYRGCKSYLFNFDMEEEEKRKIPLDKGLEVEGYQVRILNTL
jgi:hypothetical protein